MLETLEELQENVPMALPKLKRTQSHELPINMQIDSWEIVIHGQIGKGSYGLVHEAYWLWCKYQNHRSKWYHWVVKRGGDISKT
jgi:hypothetical protein